MVEASAVKLFPTSDKRNVRPSPSTSTQPSSSCCRLRRTFPSIFWPTGSPVLSLFKRVVTINASLVTSTASITVSLPDVVIEVSVASFSWSAVIVSRATLKLGGGDARAVIERPPVNVTMPALFNLAVTEFSTSLRATPTPIETAVADLPMAAAIEAALTQARTMLVSCADRIKSWAETEVVPFICAIAPPRMRFFADDPAPEKATPLLPAEMASAIAETVATTD